MQAGRLNRRLTLMQPSVSREAMGAVKREWTPVATVWCTKEPLRGREFFESQKTTSEATTRFTIRHRDDVKQTWKCQDNDGSYTIIAVINPNDANRMLQIMAKELTSGEPG